MAGTTAPPVICGFKIRFMIKTGYFRVSVTPHIMYISHFVRFETLTITNHKQPHSETTKVSTKIDTDCAYSCTCMARLDPVVNNAQKYFRFTYLSSTNDNHWVRCQTLTKIKKSSQPKQVQMTSCFVRHHTPQKYMYTEIFLVLLSLFYFIYS